MLLALASTVDFGACGLGCGGHSGRGFSCVDLGKLNWLIAHIVGVIGMPKRPVGI